jgi:P4 family phage/plasmid primase-like protien
MSIKEYKTKSSALKKLTGSNILCNRDIKNYFLQNDHIQFLNEIKKHNTPSFYEFISERVAVNLFIDIDMKEDHEFFNEHEVFILELKDKLEEFIHNSTNLETTETTGQVLEENVETDGNVVKIIILESHNSIKKSYHIIVRIYNNGKLLVFRNVVELKKFMQQFVNTHYPLSLQKKLVDFSVYREGLFRTLYSSKSDEPERPFKRNKYSDPFDDIESFITYVPDNLPISIKTTGSTVGSCSSSTVTDVNEIDDTPRVNETLTGGDLKVIKNFVRRFYKYKNTDVREIKLNKEHIIVALNDKFCGNIDKEHKSNYQYIVINSTCSKQKCHDTDCFKYKDNEISSDRYPQELLNITNLLLTSDSKELELIETATRECKNYIIENYDDKINDFQYDKGLMLFKSDVTDNNTIVLNGKCKNCLGEHQISADGYCVKCKICSTVFPKHATIPIMTQKFQTLNNFWQLIQHNTIIINNNYSKEDENFLNCDINLDNSILKNKKVTAIVNQILDGHKVSKISMLLQMQNDNIVFDDAYFYFKNNIWKIDKQNLYFTDVILNLENLFTKIQNFYNNQETNEDNTKLIKNIKCLITKLNGYKFKEEIVKESRRYFNQDNFKYKLNSKQYLVPFKNGVWDTHANEFREATRNDYINLTVNYSFDPEIQNKKVYDFVNSILPNKNIRDYVLKEFSKCLNGDIPNTKFLIFIGDGANGKSQLLNLMKLAMGDFGEKVESTLLTRKRNNPNETSSEKLKLMNKRFAFLSEPEDGEKFNIGLLKELTGSEEIVARGLYTDPVSFIMQVKLYLACNELPEVKGEDTAIWRRIRVIDFPSKFVSDPQEENEYKLDTTLPVTMREDITWRQTFMNILLEYYYLDIPEPREVQIKTNQYRDDNNEVFAWCEENISFVEGSICKLSELCRRYFENKPNPDNKTKGKFKKTFEDFLKILKKAHPKVHIDCRSSSHKGHTYQGWKNIEIKTFQLEQDEDD